MSSILKCGENENWEGDFSPQQSFFNLVNKTVSQNIAVCRRQDPEVHPNQTDLDIMT